jgi:hypothetical protein
MDGRDIPLQPWPQKFYISGTMLCSQEVELRPLTLTGLVKGVGKNFICMTWFRFRWLFFRVGFLDCPQGERLSFRHQWRWDFWNVRAARQEASD